MGCWSGNNLVSRGTTEFIRDLFMLPAPVLTGLIFVAIPAVALFCGWMSARSLPRRLRARPIMEFNEWFEKYYPDSKLDKEIVLKVQTIMVELFHHVHPTQILPTDRFDRELALPKLALKTGVGADVDCEGVMYFLMDYGVDPKGFPVCETVAQFTEEVCTLVEGKQPRSEKPMGWFAKTVYVVIIIGLLCVIGGLLVGRIK